MRMITQQDIQEAFRGNEWPSTKPPLVIGKGMDLLTFMLHPEVTKIEAIVMALSPHFCPPKEVLHVFLSQVVNRIIPRLLCSTVPKVVSFGLKYKDDLPLLPVKEWWRVQDFCEELQSLSHTAILNDDWRTFYALQLLKASYQSLLCADTVRSIAITTMLLGAYEPGGYEIEQENLYKDLVRLISEMGEGETA
jgi:hypothetical protein